MFGEDDSWQTAADWLKGLDAEKVLQYFEGRRYTTRLGDHFAACIEFVLKFSPLLSPDPLFISQQFGACTIQNQQSFRTLKKKVKGEFGSFALRKGGMMSEVIVRLIENDILIKRFSSYHYDDRGRVKEISDSEIERLIADFKNSHFDYHSYEEMQGEECHERGLRELKNGDLLHESMLILPADVGLHVTREKQKWRVHYSIAGQHKELLTGYKIQRYGPTKLTSAHGFKFESVEMVPHGTDKNSHAASDKALLNALDNGKMTTEGGGKRTRKVHMKHGSTVWRNPIKKPTLLTNSKTVLKAETAQRLKQMVEVEKGSTAGECDFLFKVNTEKLIQGSLDYSWTQIHHWEVSLHFLSYIGPWEVFGLVTPGSSIWHDSGKRILAAIEGLNSVNTQMLLETLHELPDTTGGADQISVLDACYVAPTIGDTWFDRKKSMGSKLKFCGYPNMAAKVSNLFHSLKESCRSTQECGVQASEFRELKPLHGPQGQDYGKYRDDPSIIRVIPRALTKGYLFYEPKLWHHLCMRKGQGKHPSSLTQAEKGYCSGRPRKFSTSYLSANHWMGWWVYARDFANFARSYGREGSMWYIAPRHEWLSPIIIGSAEEQRCCRVLDLVGMLTMILKVGEEAAALHPRRQRRFMVVEVCWDPDTSTAVARPSSCKLRTGKHNERLEGKGGWVEVSRGFVVEGTWPESREQLAHGFTLSWSPALLGWS